MAKIHINNPKQVINGGAKKYYFKVKGLGGPKGDKGDKGDTGATGPQGPQGNAATVSIGSTTTLPVGYDATVTNSGSIYNAVLNFGIPQGPRGPQGATGAKGDKGDKGEQGNPGPQGEKGTNATVYIGTTSTLNPGSQATVYNSGTDSNAVLNFGIPKGEKGDTGPMPTIAQTTGQAIDQVMSQKATTDALNTKQATITSSNKLSADLVDDTSTTNKFVTAQDITNWNGKQDALTAGTGIDITGDVISTPAIVPEVVAELPTTGAEGKLYLTPKAHTTSTATGNPIEATITAQAGQLESFRLDGDTDQTTYTGKNLLAFPNETYESRGITTVWLNGKAQISGEPNNSQIFITDYKTNDLAAGTYTFSLGGAVAPHRFIFRTFDANNATIASATIDEGQTSATITISGTEAKYRVIMLGVVGQQYDETDYFQLESGSTATTWEKFVGGQPSPSPSYPQQIQTVTGLQTISINGTDYPINLGSIELCKLATYQDYIWKDGDDWKIHKATGYRLLNGEENWTWNQEIGDYDYSRAYVWLGDNYIGTGRQSAVSNYFHYQGQGHAEGICFTSSQSLYLYPMRDINTRDKFIEWLGTHNTSAYYRLATATDTVITDTDLIAQLEAIRTASLENGTNTITNTATGTNLAGDMEIGYYGFNPTNRYDKFIWLDLNNNYEQIGGE